MRIDMGLLQFESTGRPDGERPHDCESLLDYHEQRLAQYRQRRRGSDAGFLLSPDECRALRQEAYLYYQRYLACFVLEEYDAVEQDTARNLRLVDLCHRHAASAEDRRALEPQRGYVFMMNVRAKAHRALQTCDGERALEIVERGIADVGDMIAAMQSDLDANLEAELGILHDLRQEVIGSLPPESPERVRWELETALRQEDYERAAELRDKLPASQRPDRRR